MKDYFDHEKLKVYQESIRLITWIDENLSEVPKGLAVRGQLDRASTSIPLNIAEGNGKYTAPDRCRFFDTARGSALECAACLDILIAKKIFAPKIMVTGKNMLLQIVNMLVGLIKSNSSDRLYETSETYDVGGTNRED